MCEIMNIVSDTTLQQQNEGWTSRAGNGGIHGVVQQFSNQHVASSDVSCHNIFLQGALNCPTLPANKKMEVESYVQNVSA